MPDEILTPAIPGTEPAAPAATEPEETVTTPEVTPEPVTPEPAPQPEAPVTPELPPLEERYRNQRSEALILNAQNKQKDELINKLTSQDAPTEAEITARYPEYPTLDDFSKRVVLDTLTNEKRQVRIDRQHAETEADRRWRQELEALSQESQYSALATDKEFERFVFNPKHKGLEIKVLADAFLLRTGKAPLDEPRTVQRQPAMPTATSTRTAPKRNKVSVEDAAILRKTNHKEYLRLVKAGMIDDEL